ncbi:Uncharacterised protein [Mycobacterium tuberculosis]|uniref:Uncharacterized protein n=1 Tax=Mycobacterium tuberculosis TaxID=1773 RepID=A0A655EW52_MYCTX|nr:Uncharacterised protein [Mycobacterium tuberculosis]
MSVRDDAVLGDTGATNTVLWAIGGGAFHGVNFDNASDTRSL